MRHAIGALLQDTLFNFSSRTVRHSFGSLLRNTPGKYSWRILVWIFYKPFSRHWSRHHPCNSTMHLALHSKWKFTPATPHPIVLLHTVNSALAYCQLLEGAPCRPWGIRLFKFSLEKFTCKSCIPAGLPSPRSSQVSPWGLERSSHNLLLIGIAGTAL